MQGKLARQDMAAKMSGGLLTRLLLFFLFPVMIQVGEAILQGMPPTDTKCVCQEINSNVDIISEDHSTISVKVIVGFPFLSPCYLDLHFII